MDEQAYFDALDAVDTGKRVGTSIYIHACAISGAVADLAAEACAIAGVSRDGVDVFKLATDAPRVSLLRYPGFWDEAFPTLASSCRVDLASGDVHRRVYDPNSNVPVLHRKERLLPSDHPQQAEFADLTRAAEEAGLFADTRIIGHAWQWEEELRAKGLKVDGHQLVPRTDDEDDGLLIKRHRTALRRHKLSTPSQALWRHGFFDGTRKFFDYGCGRGDDVDLLGKAGVSASGWDPYWLPEGEQGAAEVVNIGFVINVIEDSEERDAALLGAWNLTEQVLSVAALIGGRTAYEKYRLYEDGVLTTRGTFQKYFSHGELGSYIERVLCREPVSVGPGLYFVFRTDAAEQSFLEERQRSCAPVPRRAHRPACERRDRTAARSSKGSRWVRHAELLGEFWQRCLELGRMPADGEFAKQDQVRERLGTAKTVFRHLVQRDDDDLLEQAARHRRGDLLVYLALNLFERRRSFGSLSERVKADIKAFWGSYAGAVNDAKALLFSISDHAAITRAAWDAADDGLGHIEGGRHALTVEARLVKELPSLLRIYVGCAGKLYGEAEEADLVRLHLRSGKVTFLLCDDYDGLDVPNLIERVKVNLRRQSIRWFEYGSEEFPVQPVEGKVLFGRRWLPDVALAQVGMPLEGADAEPDPVKAAQGLQKTDGTVDPSELPAPSGMARSQG